MKVSKTGLVNILLGFQGYWSTHDLDVAEAVAEALIKKFTGYK